jgi:hypothetical protein
VRDDWPLLSQCFHPAITQNHDQLLTFQYAAEKNVDSDVVLPPFGDVSRSRTAGQ